VARVVALAPDLMFASRIQETLTAEGHQVLLVTAVSQVPPVSEVDLLVVDLDREAPGGIVGLGAPVLGFYSHTEVDTRERADAAGVDLAVPRSRMAREMPQLVERLLS
jgi:hypothetical protein